MRVPGNMKKIKEGIGEGEGIPRVKEGEKWRMQHKKMEENLNRGYWIRKAKS